MLGLHHLCSRPHGQRRGEFTAHFECKEDKSVNLLVNERVNYRRNAIFVTFFEIKI
jgi:hypothetical protein